MKKVTFISIVYTIFVGCTTTIDIDRDDYGKYNENGERIGKWIFSEGESYGREVNY